MKASKTSLTLALTAVISTVGMAHAAGNPFALSMSDTGQRDGMTTAERRA